MQFRRLAAERGVDVGAIVLVVVVAGLYVHAVRTMAGSFGFPLDDSYIYLTYARQIGRGRPFSYFDGSGFTAGAACAAAFILFCGPLAWAYLAGMEVALAGFLLLFSALALIAHEPGTRPRRGLLVLLAATAIARPEMAFVVAPVVGGCALRSAWRRQIPDALRW